jgi:amino acid transporter
LANVAYLYVNPIDTIAKSPLVAADTMSAVFGPIGALLVSLFVAVSAFGALNGLMLASPRLFFAMAHDGLFFEPIARVHRRFHTPYVAILLAALLGVALVFSRSFEALTSTFVIAIWPFYALAVAAVYRLRKRRPNLPRPYRTTGYPIVPGVFIAAAVWFLGNALATEPLSTGITFALILAGLPIYFALFGASPRVR